MRPFIIAITGKSASGKTSMAEHLENKHGIPLIRSYTDRPQRGVDDTDHTFLTIGEFDRLPVDDMMAYTNFGGKRYCCLHSDVVHPVMSYVISEDGLIHIKDMWSGRYNIISVRLIRDDGLRLKDGGVERYNRDEGRFELPDNYFDGVIPQGLMGVGFLHKKSEIMLASKMKVKNRFGERAGFVVQDPGFPELPVGSVVRVGSVPYVVTEGEDCKSCSFATMAFRLGCKKVGPCNSEDRSDGKSVVTIKFK